MNIEQVGRFIRGQGNPTYDSLRRLCTGLPISLGELVALAEALEAEAASHEPPPTNNSAY